MVVVRLIAGLAILAGLWLFGRLLGGLRGKRPPNVIRYEADLMGPAIWGAAFGIGFLVARVMQLPGWRGNGPIVLSAFMFLCFAFLTLLTFRFSIVVADDAILVKRVFRPGWRRVDWKSIRSWQAGRKAGTIIFELEPSGRIELGSAFKDGFDVLLDAVDNQQIAEAGIEPLR